MVHEVHLYKFTIIRTSRDYRIEIMKGDFLITVFMLNIQGQTRFNHLGIMMSSQRRLNFQESIGCASQNLIIANLKSNPLVKVTGENKLIF